MLPGSVADLVRRLDLYEESCNGLRDGLERNLASGQPGDGGIDLTDPQRERKLRALGYIE